MSGNARWYREMRGRRWWIVLGWMFVVAIIVLSLVSLPQMGPDLPQGDKYKHVLAYFGLTLWFARITGSQRSLLCHAALFVCIGAALEVLQSLTPERRFEFSDMLANTIGVGLAVALAAVAGAACHRVRPRKGNARSVVADSAVDSPPVAGAGGTGPGHSANVRTKHAARTRAW